MTTPDPAPALYVVNLTTGETTGGPAPTTPPTVQHCNSRTGYEMVIHPYAPIECDRCAEIAETLRSMA